MYYKSLAVTHSKKEAFRDVLSFKNFIFKEKCEKFTN